MRSEMYLTPPSGTIKSATVDLSFPRLIILLNAIQSNIFGDRSFESITLPDRNDFESTSGAIHTMQFMRHYDEIS